jgi:hypothetical protein
MLRFFAAAILSSFFFELGPVFAGDCAPHCAFYHDDGPYNFSYIRPGLFGYPVCDREGNCSPYLVYIYSGHQVGSITITVRPVSKHIRRSFGKPKNYRVVRWF